MNSNPEGVDSNDTSPDRFKKLAELYRSGGFIIRGIDNEAEANNLLVVESIKAAGESLKSLYNDVFGICMAGSRIRGYNTAESDIDLFVIMPDSAPTETERIACEAVEQELEKRGLRNGIDTNVEMWSDNDITTNAEEFIYQIDHHGQMMSSLFGFTPYCNANLLLSQLSALEVVNRYTKVKYDWKDVAEEYARDYVGEEEFLVERLSEKFGLSPKEVRKTFTKELFDERYKQLGLGEPEAIYDDLCSWYKENYRKFIILLNHTTALPGFMHRDFG